MNCPNKACQAEIPEDSVFCDQCGKHLGKCEKCGMIAVSKFCNKCGGMIKLLAVQSPATLSATTVFAPAGEETVVEAPDFLAEKKLTLVSKDGWTLEVNDGDLLGRTQGPHTAKLGTCPAISSRHGMVTKQGNAWCYTDIGSSNGSYLNKARLEKNCPIELHDTDELVLANLVFTVKIA